MFFDFAKMRLIFEYFVNENLSDQIIHIFQLHLQQIPSKSVGHNFKLIFTTTQKEIIVFIRMQISPDNFWRICYVYIGTH